MVLNHPLVSDKSRYPSEEMKEIWSEERKFLGWRDFWIALAETQYELDPKLVTKEQVEELKAKRTPINYDRANQLEKELRHDVMAHIKAYGEQCPLAAPIIHLGATSMEPCDNTELLQIRDSLKLIKKREINVIYKLANLAVKYADMPALARTHMQVAQPTTVGKKFADYCYDVCLDVEHIDFVLEHTWGRGVKGTTGTQDSFMKLFDGDEEKVKTLDKLVSKKIGFDQVFEITTQTYSRKLDDLALNPLKSMAIGAHKFGLDLREYQMLMEIQEPFEKGQVGSSAMPYKRNPMRSERMCGLARYVINNTINAAYNAALQIFERTLDDSANRRLILSETFLAADAVLILYQNILNGIVINEKIIERNLKTALPFLATETIMMEAVKRGANRQEIHESIRQATNKATALMFEGKDYDLLKILSEDELITKFVSPSEINNLMEPKNYVGRAPQMAKEFGSSTLKFIELNHKDKLGINAEVKV